MTQRFVNYTYGTGNPVLPNGSTDVRDGIDNLQSMDVFMNAPEDKYNQRDGEIVRTISGMNTEFDAHILNMGFTRIGTFAAGATITNPRQTLLWDIADGGDGQEYGWSGAFQKVVPATSTPASTGGISVGAWVSRFDPELRIQVREALRRSYAEAGYTLVDGSFEAGGTLVNANDVLLHEASGKALSGPAGTYLAGTSTAGFTDRSGELLRNQLALPYATIYVDLPPYNGDLKAALTAAAPGNTFVLGNKTYNIKGLYSHDFNFGNGPFIGNTIPNLTIQGCGKPRVSDNGRSLTGGTIIQGTLFNLAHGFSVFDLGVDFGMDVIENVYDGVYGEGFVPCANTSFPTSQPLIHNITIDNVISLGGDPTAGAETFKHTVLIENGYNVKIGTIEAVGGCHTFVSKAIRLQAANVSVKGGVADSVIFKSDKANPCQDNQISNLIIDDWYLDGIQKKAAPMIYQSGNVAYNTSSIQIGNLIMQNLINTQEPIQFHGDQPIENCNIGHLLCDLGADNQCCLRIGYSDATVYRFHVETFNMISGGTLIELGAKAIDCHVGSGTQTLTSNSSYPTMTFDATSYSHGEIIQRYVGNCTNAFAIQRNAGDFDYAKVTMQGNVPALANRYSGDPYQTVSLSSGVTNPGFTGFKAPGFFYTSPIISLTGALRITSAKAIGDVVFTIPLPPGRVIRALVPYQDASNALTHATIEIDKTGAAKTLIPLAANSHIFIDGVIYSLGCL